MKNQPLWINYQEEPEERETEVIPAPTPRYQRRKSDEWTIIFTFPYEIVRMLIRTFIHPSKHGDIPMNDWHSRVP